MRVSVKTIHQFGIDVMKAAGLDDYEAEHLSHSLIFADLRGCLLYTSSFQIKLLS